MQDDPLQDESSRIDDRLVAARDLLFRRRYRDALELINAVVLVSPSDPRAFLVRAAAFEGMDLIPQADADLDHARQLCVQQGTDFDALVDELNSPPPKRKPEGKRRERAERPPAPPRRPSRGAGAGEFAIIIGFIIFLAAAVGAGSYIVIGSLDINNGDDDGAAAANPTPTPVGATATPPAALRTAAATPTRTPAPSLPPGVDGDPYSLSSIEAAWEAEGMTVTGGSAATGFTGFSLAPTSVTVSRSGTSVDTAVFVYDDPSAPAEDWTLVVGQRPVPKPGRTIPTHFTIYWNTNVVIVVLDDPGALGADLLDGILNMAP